MDKWIYEILLNDKVVFNSGDEIFKSEEKAKADAEYCINDYLVDEYGIEPSAFEVCTYCAIL